MVMLLKGVQCQKKKKKKWQSENGRKVTVLHVPVDNVEVFCCWKALRYVTAKVDAFARYAHDDNRVILLRQLLADGVSS
jgi:hypothetical protein